MIGSRGAALFGINRVSRLIPHHWRHGASRRSEGGSTPTGWCQSCAWSNALVVRGRQRQRVRRGKWLARTAVRGRCSLVAVDADGARRNSTSSGDRRRKQLRRTASRSIGRSSTGVDRAASAGDRRSHAVNRIDQGRPAHRAMRRRGDQRRRRSRPRTLFAPADVERGIRGRLRAARGRPTAAIAAVAPPAEGGRSRRQAQQRRRARTTAPADRWRCSPMRRATTPADGAPFDAVIGGKSSKRGAVVLDAEDRRQPRLGEQRRSRRAPARRPK